MIRNFSDKKLAIVGSYLNAIIFLLVVILFSLIIFLLYHDLHRYFIHCIVIASECDFLLFTLVIWYNKKIQAEIFSRLVK
jgi:hypothetical protein